MDFTSSLADPDVWMRPSILPNGEEYYEYILVYVDDLLIISHRGIEILELLTSKYQYRLKDVGPPSRYLGAIVGRYDKNGRKTWYMSAKDYLSKALPVVEEHYGSLNKYKADTPLPPNYHPEDDRSPFLKDEEISLYQSFIGTLRWGVELGRIELTFAVSLMSRFSTAPRTDHMQKLLHMFSYIKRHLDSKLVFDAGTRDWSHINFLQHDWNEFYPDAMETMPPNAPEPRGRAVQLNMFCDAAHANDHVTRRSTTGLVIFILGTPILWYSKRQNTIETSTFGSEFVALKIATELLEGLRYRLRMMGIPLQGTCNTFCDNGSVVNNVSDPTSTLTKKHNAVAYHKGRESVAAGTQRIAHEMGKFNLSDVLTKNLSVYKHKACCCCLLHLLFVLQFNYFITSTIIIDLRGLLKYHVPKRFLVFPNVLHTSILNL